MGTITVWGESDDLIEVRGDVPDEEFNDVAFMRPGGIVRVSTGDELVVAMDLDGNWRVDHSTQSTGSTLEVIKRPDYHGDTDDKGGTLTTAGPIEWVEVTVYGQPNDLVQPGRVYATGAAPDTTPTDVSQPLP